MAILQLQMKSLWTQAAVGPASTNTFYFDTDAEPNVTAAPILASAVAAFWDDITHWGSLLSGVGEISVYDTADIPAPGDPREPIYTATTGFATEADTLPSEVSIMLTAVAAAATGGSRKRGHWRTRLGPLSVDTVDAVGRFTEAFTDEVFAAYGTMSGTLQGLGITQVCGSVQYGFRPVTRGAVSNAPYIVSKRDLPASYVAST